MNKNEILAKLSDVSVVLADLRRKDFSSREILDKYFVNNKGYLSKTFHVPSLTREVYESVVATLRNVSEVNQDFTTASDYYKRKVLAIIIAKDLGVSPKNIDFTGYAFDENWYKLTSEELELEYMEELFRESEKNSRSAKNLYIDEDDSQDLPLDLFNALYKFCIKAICRRIAMTLEIEGCFSTLLGIMKSTNGFSSNATSAQVDALKGFTQHFIRILQDEEVKKFILEHSDIDIFDKNDVVATYQKLFRMFSDIREGSLDYCKDVFHNEKDIYEDEILANEYLLVEESVTHENYDEDNIDDKVGTLIY